MNGDVASNGIVLSTAHLPNVARARLPATYEQARAALSTCVCIDECKDWADKMAALASYAKQSKDETLRNAALRIQARAVRRCVELLEEIDAERGKRTDQPGGGATTRLKAAQSAGMSRDQATQALRVARVPEEEFDREVEGDDPPTVSELAKRGTKPKPKHHNDPRAPDDIRACIKGNGALRSFVEETTALDIVSVVRGTLPCDRREVKIKAKKAIAWLRRLLAEHKKENAR